MNDVKLKNKNMEEKIRHGFDESSYTTFGNRSSKPRSLLLAGDSYGLKDDEEGLICNSESDYDEEESETEEIAPRSEEDPPVIEEIGISPFDRYINVNFFTAVSLALYF